MDDTPKFRSFSDSFSDDERSLNPGLDREDRSILGESVESKKSTLWHQYSLIHKSFQSVQLQEKPDLCFCCGSMSFRHTSLKAIFVIVVGLGLLISALSLRYSTYSTDNLTFTGGDQILVPTSTYFNEQVEFIRKTNTKTKQQLDTVLLYILPDVPVISAKRSIYNDAVKFYIPSWSYQYWGLHLLAGTELRISICADLHLQFYILKSERKLKDWKQTTLFYKFDFQTRIHPQRSCSEKKGFKSHLLKVTESDVYYLLFSSSVGWRFFTEVAVVLNFNRTYYDVSNYISKCTLIPAPTLASTRETKGCLADLRYGSMEIALLQAASNITHPRTRTFYNLEFDYSPLPRWSFYGNLFGYIYLAVIAGTFVYSIWRCCVRLYCLQVSCDKEREPLLPEARPSAYSLHEPWVVVSPTRKTVASEEDHSDGSVSEDDVRDPDEVGPLPPRRRPKLGSMIGNEAAEVLFKRSQSQSSRNDRMRRENQYLNDQQLLDSVMTSAGISAI